MNIYTRKGRTSILIAVFSFFCLVYCAESLINHYLYRTFALDLGMFNQALYSISHGLQPLFTLDTKGTETHFLATHFSPITFLFAPLYYLFGSYTLLIVQITFILMGGLGIYKIAQLKLAHLSPALWLLAPAHFFCCWGIYSALAFDFHNNVIGAMIAPWFIYFFCKRNKKLMLITAILMAMCQETMPLWLIFILAALMLDNAKTLGWKNYLKFELPLIAGFIIYALIIIQLVMPALQGAEHNLQLSRYTHLGSSASEIVAHILSHPIDSVKMLFVNTIDDPAFDYIKAELHIMVLLSGGIFLLTRPAYLLMLVPIYAQKLLANDFGFWGINVQYSIELIPVICIGTILFLSKLRKGYTVPVAVITLCVTLAATISTIDHRKSKWYNAANNRFYGKDHFKSGFDNLAEVNQVLKSVPDALPVVTSSRLAAHIANRQRLYHFPNIKMDARYIVLDKSGDYSYPLSKEDYLQQIELLRANPNWIIATETTDLIIFKKK